MEVVGVAVMQLERCRSSDQSEQVINAFSGQVEAQTQMSHFEQ